MDKKKYTGNSYKYIIIGTVIMIIAAVATAFVFGYFIRTVNSIERRHDYNFTGHYVFVADENDSEFWNSVYEEARIQAQKDNIYLENIKESLDGNYNGAGLLRVAINSAVDGIMYAGSGSEEVVELINEATKRGICVVVMHNDIETSLRQCFVGMSYYELGQMYANQVARMLDNEGAVTKKSIAVLVNGDMSEGSANLITLAMEDVFSDVFSVDDMPQIEIIRINAEDTFSAEEDIRNLFLAETNIPDIMVCLEGSYTQCVYQAVVDYNLVGEVSAVGYFSNEDILEAIDKQIIYSTISVDTSEMGRAAVLAIEEYNEMGYTNSYMPVGMTVIGKEEAERELEEIRKKEVGE